MKTLLLSAACLLGLSTIAQATRPPVQVKNVARMAAERENVGLVTIEP